jgi:cyclomaltodextrinase / maltogenic alpha-amylase / neopullulanase
MLRIPSILVALLAVFFNTPSIAWCRASWTNDAVIYGVVPDLFGRHGLPDVTKHIGDIAELGANVLWLSPITDAPRGDFGYAVTDHFRIRRSLGSDADLAALISAAHARGIRVILDIAANDLSSAHPFYRDAMRRGRASPYYEFFDRAASGVATHYFDWNNLENLNFDNPAVRSYVIDVFTYWLRRFDVDGFRVDAAWGPRQRAPDFWPTWEAALRHIKPDILLLAEAPKDDPYYAGAGFDAAYDWSGGLGKWSWRGAFDSAAPAATLRSILAAGDHGITTFRFLDNNDTGARFVTRHGAAMMRVAAAMLLTLPGLPSVYAGEETGAVYEPYAPHGPLDWKEGTRLRRTWHDLIMLRHREPALRTTDMRLVGTSDDAAVLAYLRPGTCHRDGLLVLLNYGAEPVSLQFPERSQGAPVLDEPRLVDLMTGERIAIDPAAPVIPLSAMSARVLQPAPRH